MKLQWIASDRVTAVRNNAFPPLRRKFSTSRRFRGISGFACTAAIMLSMESPAAYAGTVTYIYTDAQGSPLAESDNSGAVTASFDYRPYGGNFSGGGMSTPQNGPGYTGHVSDVDTAFVYMQARYYDPSIGRFLSVDPIKPSAADVFNFSRFDYVRNNPLAGTDPDGRGPFSDWISQKKDEFNQDLGVAKNLLSGNWQKAVSNASVKVGWTSPTYGVGSGTLQLGLENGHGAAELKFGVGAAGGLSSDLNTKWNSIPSLAGQPRAWIGGSVSLNANLGPVAIHGQVAEGSLVANPSMGVKGYQSTPSAVNVSLKATTAASVQFSGGAFVHLGFVSPNQLVDPGPSSQPAESSQH